MPATEPTTADIPRAVRHRIVSMLARLMYPAERIARENHVTVEIVEALRAEHGPGVKELCEAAEWLARPAKADKPKPTPTTGDGLASTEERRECRAWALVTGRTTAGVGPLSRSIVEAWEAAGRPEAPQSEPTPEPAEEPAEETPDDEPDDEPEAAEVTAGACSPEEDVIDAPIVCGACGEPLPDPTADGCPYCGAEFERVQADKHAEWSEFYVQCLTIPELATECEAVAAAVYRLRDAHAEHLHREQLIMRVQDAIKPHLHLTLNQVRLVLDAIEAA